MLTTNYVPGAPNWVTLGAPDVEAAIRFYNALFGWQFQSAGPEAGGYGFFQLDGKTAAGVGPLPEGERPAWTPFFHTHDADATAKAVEQAGGNVRMAPDDVFTYGRMAVFTDPTGAEFGLWQPNDIKGLDTVTVPNTVCWLELYTSDTSAAKGFYRSVFDWDMETVDTPMGKATYTVVSPSGGGRDASHGGIMQLTPENLRAASTSEWHPYFEVTDCDAAVATAEEKGATVIIPAQDMEGIGRMAMFTDPFGAAFAVITSATE